MVVFGPKVVVGFGIFMTEGSGYASGLEKIMDLAPDPVLIRNVLRGWIRIQSISDRIRNPEPSPDLAAG